MAVRDRSLLLRASIALSALALTPACDQSADAPVKRDAKADADADAKKPEAKVEAKADAKADAKANATGDAKAETAHKKASEKPPIYDVDADFSAEVERALAQAKRENKRVLLMFGGNWCGWCHKLHELFEADAPIRDALASGYVLVMIDSHNGEAIATRFETPLDKGVPFLTVLDADGGVLVRQETGSLEDGPRHDPAKVLAFLEQHKTGEKTGKQPV